MKTIILYRSDGKRKKKTKQLLDDFTETRWYWKWKKEALVWLCRDIALEEAVHSRKTTE
jgi:hypothetical protein